MFLKINWILFTKLCWSFGQSHKKPVPSCHNQQEVLLPSLSHNYRMVFRSCLPADPTPGITEQIGHSISRRVTWQGMCVRVCGRFHHRPSQRSVQRTTVQRTGHRTVRPVSNIITWQMMRMDIYCTAKAPSSTVAVRTSSAITTGGGII